MNRKAWMVVALLVVLASGAGLWMGLRKDAITRRVAAEWIAQATGLQADLETSEARLWDRSLRITGLRLTNPDGFAERDAFDVPLVYARATWRTLLGLDQRLEKLHLRIERVQLVRLADGTTNLDAMNEGRPLFGAAPAMPGAIAFSALATVGMSRLPQEAAPTAPTSRPDLRIDHLRIYIGSVRFVDYTMGAYGKPMELDYAVQEERIYENVTDLERVLGEMMVSLALQALPRNMGAVLPLAMEQLEEAAPELMQGLRDLLGGSLRSRRQDPD